MRIMLLTTNRNIVGQYFKHIYRDNVSNVFKAFKKVIIYKISKLQKQCEIKVTNNLLSCKTCNYYTSVSKSQY